MQDDTSKSEDTTSTPPGASSTPSGTGNDQSGNQNIRVTKDNSRRVNPPGVERYGSVDPESYGSNSEIIDPTPQVHSAEISEYLVERSAPLPTVEEFQGYDRVLPGAADRILHMAEMSMDAVRESVRADVEVQKSIAYSVRSGAKIAERQQWIFAALAAIALIGSFWLAWNGKDIPSVIGIVVAAGSSWVAFQAFQKGQKITPSPETEN